MCVYTHINRHTHVHIYTYVYIYIHTCYSPQGVIFCVNIYIHMYKGSLIPYPPDKVSNRARTALTCQSTICGCAAESERGNIEQFQPRLNSLQITVRVWVFINLRFRFSSMNHSFDSHSRSKSNSNDSKSFYRKLLSSQTSCPAYTLNPKLNPYFGGSGDSVSRLITGMNGVTIWVIRVINLLTKSP